MLKQTTMWLVAGLLAVAAASVAGQDSKTYIVKDGKPEAEIVVAEKPPRTTVLAARELQRGVKKITGAELPIVKKPTDAKPVKIYVGESPYAEKLGITDEGLKFGAYRVVSGKDWLVLIGDDANFKPVEPWMRDRKELKSEEYKKKWDELTGTHYWGPANTTIWKWSTCHPSQLVESPPLDKPVDVWGFDERGSFNAVCGFLRKLGMRWYMPGDVGEVVPKMTSIALPKIDETVQPDMPYMRDMQYVPFCGPREAPMWLMRLGVRRPYGFNVAHGMGAVTRREEVKKDHPEWFAKYGNKERQGPQACFSSESLFEEVVKHARFMFDHYDVDAVSVMPEDGYVSMCQCELCEGKDTPERGHRGRMSDHVWGFVNRVAKEIAKTHPDKKIVCDAYGTYWLPPLKIDKLHPNVQVGVVSGRRPKDDKPDEQKRIRDNLKAWMAKTDNKVFIFENYPMSGGLYLPWFVPHVNAETINFTKGHSIGESIWTRLRGKQAEPGFYHFPVYFTMRMYWGGENQDVDAMLEEYYRLFYGPAEQEMKAFFEYCEKNWREIGQEKPKAEKVLELFDAAQKKVDPESIYGKRVAIMDRFLDRLRKKLDSIGAKTKRIGVPELILADAKGKVKIDGKLDDEMWKNVPDSSGGEMKELKTGEKPEFATDFKVARSRDGLYFAFRCEESKDDPPEITTTKKDDTAVYYGDNVEILLETPSHSYYQVTVNPAGAVADLDRSKGRDMNWDSQAQAATDVGEGYWTAEIFFPIVEDDSDPNHNVVGKGNPTKENPWFLNICRQRVRGKKTEHSAYSPTMTRGFHVLEKFAKMRQE